MNLGKYSVEQLQTAKCFRLEETSLIGSRLGVQRIWWVPRLYQLRITASGALRFITVLLYIYPQRSEFVTGKSHISSYCAIIVKLENVLMVKKKTVNHIDDFSRTIWTELLYYINLVNVK